MDTALAMLLLPAAAAVVLAAVPDPRWAARLNVGAATGLLALAVATAVRRPQGGDLLLIDDFNVYLLVLTAFIGTTTSIFSAGYVAHEVNTGRLPPRMARFYHAMFQAFLASLVLALLANNLGLMWVAVEGATLTTVLMVSLYRTPAAIEAAWKYFILCGVGIALALFGTILTYLAAQPVLGGGAAGMTWSVLLTAAPKLDPGILSLAFVFILIGYGTKVGLFPLNGWLPDAHAEGPTPISAVLSGLLLNVALYAVLRFKMLLAGNSKALDPGLVMIVMGLATVLTAAFMLFGRRDVKRFFAFSSIKHMGVMTVAFGIGGPVANFAGLLHMTVHSLAKSGIFHAVGHLSQRAGGQRFDDLRGLTVSHPPLGWGLLAGIVAISGLPPFGLFMSEFLVVTTAAASAAWVAAALAAGLLVGLAALASRAQWLCFGTPTLEPGPSAAHALVPLYAHLALVAAAGLWLPAPLVVWFQSVAALLG